MKELKVDWLGTCSKCGCRDMRVRTERGDGEFLYDGDSVECGGCGEPGLVESDDSGTYVVFDWESI